MGNIELHQTFASEVWLLDTSEIGSTKQEPGK